MTFTLIQGDNRQSIQSRFNKKYSIDPITQCWVWHGSRDAEGYGVLWDNRIKNNVRAHRISMELNGTPIPSNLYTLHQCDNKSCVNPQHLRAGTNQENVNEAKERGLLKNMSSKRKQYIQSLNDEEFEIWCKQFEGKTGRSLANLTTAKSWRHNVNI